MSGQPLTEAQARRIKVADPWLHAGHYGADRLLAIALFVRVEEGARPMARRTVSKDGTNHTRRTRSEMAGWIRELRLLEREELAREAAEAAFDARFSALAIPDGDRSRPSPLAGGSSHGS
jgi:hypothetical protein